MTEEEIRDGLQAVESTTRGHEDELVATPGDLLIFNRFDTRRR
jgi:hypothetical protein